MSPKTTRSAPTGGKSPREGLVTPGRVVVAVLGVLALVFVFENTRSTRIRLLVPEVTMPLWMALLATGLIGALCGAYAMRRRR
ncbi:LapA family protein [Streptomyces sp. NPDC007084]|uniref:LapA family protein n=1 Tax=Streptomyces sp. NPDC007084 TaxID=3154313 RepID=UPI003453C28A